MERPWPLPAGTAGALRALLWPCSRRTLRACAVNRGSGRGILPIAAVFMGSEILRRR